MKKLLIVSLIAILLLISLCACNPDEEKDDTITIYVGLGNNKTYYSALLDLINEELPDLNVKYIYQNSYDTTTAARLEYINNDVPTDIMITASKTPNEYLKDSCVDLLKNSSITKYFSYSKVKECTSSDGAVYQLPFTSKLIGITYNKTLLEENGWETPKNYADMLALKQACDDNGIKFAVSDGNLTGHGFNWFFHLMGADWISSIDGTTWIENFIAGKVDTTELAPEAEYFKKWYENGLFGEFHATDRGFDSFSKTRALFYYNITNSNYSYTGEMLDDNGEVIDGVTLNDTYASIPWISEDGLSNYFTQYDNMFLSLNKNLLSNENKLKNCLKVLELMTSQKAIQIYTNTNNDGYIAVNSFKPSDKCMFKDYINEINAGQIQPWYYNYFDSDTIVNTGDIINRYLNGEQVALNDILVELQRNVSNNANDTTPNSGIVFDETLSYKDVAKINAIAGAKTAQALLDDSSINEEVTVSLIAYVDSLEEMPLYMNELGLVQVKFYKGNFNDVNIKSVIPTHSSKTVAIKLTGAEILDIVDKGLDRSKELKYDSSYGPFKILAVTKGGFTIDKNQTYTVALNKSLFTQEKLTELNSRFLIDNKNNFDLYQSNIISYLASLKHVSSSNIVWQ